MTTVDELAIETIAAKEQLKNINKTIGRDRTVLAELEKSIEEKNAHIQDLNKNIEYIQAEKTNLVHMKAQAEKDYGEVRDGLKAEISKLTEKKKKDTEKYQIAIEELSNNIKVLTDRKAEIELLISNLESEIRQVRANKDNEIANADTEIKKVQDKLNDFILKFTEQDARYNKKESEIKEMELQLADKENLTKEVAKVEKALKKTEEKLLEKNSDLSCIMSDIEQARQDFANIINEKNEVEKELTDYVKKKLDLKDRKDKLDAKEKYLRKRYEEAGIDF